MNINVHFGKPRKDYNYPATNNTAPRLIASHFTPFEAERISGDQPDTTASRPWSGDTMTASSRVLDVYTDYHAKTAFHAQTEGRPEKTIYPH